MTFGEAQFHLDELGVDAMKHMAPSTQRIEAICEALNHPERAVPAIHITGTNGKTSSARIATSLLGALGLSVGTYTSPHLESVTERICHSGDPLSEEDFGEVFANVKPYIDHVEKKLGQTLTYFEVLTSMFFFWAAEQPVDAMVVEVGLGGRWDATNVVPSRVAAITNVGLDHTALLGNERTTIAAEKAGIIKDKSIVVTGERFPDVLRVIDEEAAAHDATVSRIDRDFGIRENQLAVGGRYLSLDTSSASYEELFLPLHGAHQGSNAAVALEAVARFLPAQEIERSVVEEGFAATTVPGRMETLRHANSTAAPVVLDVAHNPEGMAASVSAAIEAFPFERLVCVVGILADKDHDGMLRELARVNATLITTQAMNVRSVGADELKAAAEALGLEAEVIGNVPAAIGRAIEIASPGDLIFITGSHYVVGEARTHLGRAR